MGYQIIAVSPDRPSKLAESDGKHDFAFQLVSDATLDVAKGFGLAFQVDAATVEKYKTYGIDLVDASGEPHKQLPVPAVYLVGTDGIVDFQYVNPDYSVRISGDVVLAAAKATVAHDAQAKK